MCINVEKLLGTKKIFTTSFKNITAVPLQNVKIQIFQDWCKNLRPVNNHSRPRDLTTPPPTPKNPPPSPEKIECSEKTPIAEAPAGFTTNDSNIHDKNSTSGEIEEKNSPSITTKIDPDPPLRRSERLKKVVKFSSHIDTRSYDAVPNLKELIINLFQDFMDNLEKLDLD